MGRVLTATPREGKRGLLLAQQGKCPACARTASPTSLSHLHPALAPFGARQRIPMDRSRHWSRPKRKNNTHSPREMKNKCTNPAKPSCLILDLTVVFNLVLSFLLSLPLASRSQTFLPPLCFLLPGCQHCAFNAWELVGSWEVPHGAEGIWHCCCIPSGALAAASCEGSPVEEEVVPAWNGSFTKAEAA